MAIDYPPNPLDGDTITIGGVRRTYIDADKAWIKGNGTHLLESVLCDPANSNAKVFVITPIDSEGNNVGPTFYRNNDASHSVFPTANAGALVECPDDKAFRDANGDEWAYRVDTNGALHRWFAKQPPVEITATTNQDVVSTPIQVPQTDFRAEALVLSDDYSNASQGICGQWIASPVGQAAWAVRLASDGKINVYGSDGVTNLVRNPANTIYDVGIVDARKLLVRLDFRHLGASIDVDVSVGQPSFDVLAHTREQLVELVGTVSLPFANLNNMLLPFHAGSRYRISAAGADGRECLLGIIERATLVVGSTVVANFPNPAAAETWTSSGTNLAAPPPFQDVGGPCNYVANGQTATVSGAFYDACQPQDLPGSGDPTDSFDPALYPQNWRQIFTGGATGTQLWIVLSDSLGNNQWKALA